MLRYELLKQKWIEDHQDATAKEYEQAMREIARKLGV